VRRFQVICTANYTMSQIEPARATIYHQSMLSPYQIPNLHRQLKNNVLYTTYLPKSQISGLPQMCAFLALSPLIRYPIRINDRSNPLIRRPPHKAPTITTTPPTIPACPSITHRTHSKLIRIRIRSQNRPRHCTRRLRIIDIGIHI
jgi:hypothetical protein